MDEDQVCYEHNKLEFFGVRIKRDFAKLINDTMYERSELDGAYGFTNLIDQTYFVIYPESENFGSIESEHRSHLLMYKAIYMSVISRHPEAIESS